MVKLTRIQPAPVMGSNLDQNDSGTCAAQFRASPLGREILISAKQTIACSQVSFCNRWIVPFAKTQQSTVLQCLQCTQCTKCAVCTGDCTGVLVCTGDWQPQGRANRGQPVANMHDGHYPIHNHNHNMHLFYN